MRLFEEKSERTDFTVCIDINEIRESVEKTFSPIKLEDKSINICDVIGDNHNEILSIEINSNEMLENVYKTLYGNDYKSLFEHSMSSVVSNRNKEWTKNDVLTINWDTVLAMLYVFSFSSEDFYSLLWKQLSKILFALKGLNCNEWKKLFDGKVQDVYEGVDEFWDAVKKILVKKSTQLINDDISEINTLEYVEPFIDEESFANLEMHSYLKLKDQLKSELNRFAHTRSDNIKDVDLLYYKFVSFINITADHFNVIKTKDIKNKINSVLSDTFEEIGDVLTEYKSYSTANKAYICAIVYTENPYKISVLRKKNKSICRFVPVKDRFNERIEKEKYYSKIDENARNLVEKKKNIKLNLVRICFVSLITFFVVFLSLVFVGLVVSIELFDFAWKASLVSLFLCIVVPIIIFFFDRNNLF